MLRILVVEDESMVADFFTLFYRGENETLVSGHGIGMTLSKK